MFEARVVTISKVLGARLRTNHQDNKSVAQKYYAWWGSAIYGT